MESNGTNKQTTNALDVFNQGWRLHKSRRYEEAAKCYKKAAALGCQEAFYFLALLYYEGKGVEKDLVEATKCFEIVVEMGGELGLEAKLRLERLADIDSGKGIGIIGVEKDYDIACGCGFGDGNVERYRTRWKWAEQGHLNSQREVAFDIFTLLDCDKSNHPDADGETMLRYLRKFAELGDVCAQEILAEVYDNNDIVAVGIGDVDHEEALKWYRKAAKGGNETAQYLLESYYGEKVKTDKGEAFLAQIHHMEDKGPYTNYYIEKIGFPYFDEVVYWYRMWYTQKEVFDLCKRFAEQGDAACQKNLGLYYYNGVKVKKSYPVAVEWFTEAAEQGNGEAQLRLGDLYFEGEKVEQDYVKAVHWYMKTAEHQEDWHECVKGSLSAGWAGYNLATWRACKRLGWCYHEGKGVEQDDKTAALWYEKAGRILMNNPDGGGELGDIAESYFDGDGIYQDREEAIKWYKRAAEKGHIYSQRRLAEMYEEGGLVPQDYKEAFKWYDKMTECGDIEALYITGLYYLEGKGVKANKEEAIARIKKAASVGFKEAKAKLAELLANSL